MSVQSVNPGPVAPENTMTLTDELAVLNNIWLELKVISLILKQGFNITDEDAAIRNSLTVVDLTNKG